MRVTSVRVKTVAVRDDDLRAGAAERQAKVRPIVTVRIRTDQGVEGIGVAFVFGGLTRALETLVEELADETIGQDPTRIEQVAGRLRAHAANLAQSGMFLIALSAIDCALWDIRGKCAGQPLWRLLGGSRGRIAAYCSGRLHREVAEADLARAAERAVAHGFGYLKMHLGLSKPANAAAELRRASVVRAAVGPDIHLGCDINERWSVAEATSIGRRLEEIGFFWIEDPTRGDDYDGLARIAQNLATPIMAGETAWGMTPFRLMLERRSVDVVMIDVMQVGGITSWLKVAAMAEAFNVQVVSHILPEIQAPLVAAIPNGLMAEHKEWIWRLFEGVPEFSDGDFVMSERPGLGLSFSREFAELI